MVSLRDYLQKARIVLTPEQRYEARMAMRGRTSDSAEDHPDGGSGSRYEVYQETCPSCGHPLHGVHRVHPNGSVDPRAVSYDDDPNEAEEVADKRSAEAAYKSHAAPNSLSKTAAKIKHCGQDGRGFWNPRSKTVWWVAADSDCEENGYTSGQEIERLFHAVPGVKAVRVEYEGYPPKDEDWQSFTMRKNRAACPCCGDKTCDCTPDCEHCDCNRPLKKSGVSTDTKEHGVMVALYPDPKIARSLAIPGGEEPKEIHLTIGYFGKDDDLSTAQQNALKNLTHQLATKLAGFPLEGRVSGLGYFQQPDSDQEVLYASVDVPGLNSVYNWLLTRCRAKGLPMSGDHGFTPHMTLTYQTKGTPRPKRATPLPEIVFTPQSLVCKIGSERHVFIPGDTECPACGQEDCCCIEMADITKSFRAYRQHRA